MSELSFEPFRVAAVHASPVYLDRARTLDKAVGLIEAAGREGARFVVFPEAFLPGFPYWVNLSGTALHQPLFVRLWEHAVDLCGTPALVEPLREAAARAGAVVVMGLTERAGGTLFNTQLFLGEDGRVLGWRRKLVPTAAERTVWGYGDGSGLRVWETPLGNLGGLMCWEHTLNLARQALIVQGEHLHASSWPGLGTLRRLEAVYQGQVEAMAKTHALTGGCFVVVAMNPITEDVFETLEPYLGRTELMRPGPAWSAIIHPTTALLGERRDQEEGLVCAEVSLRDVIAAKYLLDTAGHSSRPEVLSLVLDRTAYQPATFVDRAATRSSPGSSGEAAG